jgi:hypothetical protein
MRLPRKKGLSSESCISFPVRTPLDFLILLLYTFLISEVCKNHIS